MKKNLLKIRPFNVGGAFEILLPNKKTILIDPCFTYYLADKSIHSVFDGGYTREDVAGADYIFLTHSHWDHDMDIGYFVKRYNSKVFCNALCAEELLKYHDLCYDNVFPVFPQTKYTLDDFSFEAFQGKHNAMLGRKFEENCQSAGKIGVTDHARCDQLGNLFSLDYLITTNEGETILMASGQVIWNNLFELCRTVKPDILLRQAGFRSNGAQVSAEQLAGLLLSYHAKIIFPYHHELMVNQYGSEWVNSYFLEVKRYIEEKSSIVQFVNPEAWKWYSIGYEVIMEE